MILIESVPCSLQKRFRFYSRLDYGFKNIKRYLFDMIFFFKEPIIRQKRVNHSTAVVYDWPSNISQPDIKVSLYHVA